MTVNRENRINLVLMAILFIIASALYVNTFGNGYVSDDNYQIVKNAWIKDFSNLPRILFSSVWDFLPGEGDSNYYRPVKYIFYTLAYSLSGLEPWGYHLIKLLLHAINTCLLFIVSTRLIIKAASWNAASGSAASGTAGNTWKDGLTNGDWSVVIPFISALLFAAHPIATESVSWIAAMPEVSCTLFALLCIMAHMSGRYPLAALCLLFSALSKETGVVVPFILISYDLVVARVTVRPFGRHLWPNVKRYILYIIAGCVYIAMRVYALSGAYTTISMGQGSGGERLYDMVVYIINLPLLLFIKYFGKLFFPVNITFFNYKTFNAVESLGDARVLLSLFLLAVCVLFLVWSYKRRPLLLFAFTWVLIPLVPVFALGLTGGVPIYESRYLYLSIPGFTIFVAVFSGRLAGINPAVRVAVYVALAIVVAAFSFGTVKQNRVWESDFTVWQNSAIKNPDNGPARMSYGIELAKVERLDEALFEFEAAARLDPKKSGAYNNIGIIYARRGQMDRAATEFKRAVELDPENLEARDNLSRALNFLREEGR